TGRPRPAETRHDRAGSSGGGVHPIRTELASLLQPQAPRAAEEHHDDDPILRRRLKHLFLPADVASPWTVGRSSEPCGSLKPAIRDKWDGQPDRILSRRAKRAREDLMALPGVGPKTADVVLSMAGGRPTSPVDTHTPRIAGRWELTRRKDYESIRRALEEWTPPGKRKAWHLAIIAHGRALCK